MRMALVEYSVHLWATFALRIRYLKVPVSPGSMLGANGRLLRTFQSRRDRLIIEDA